MTLIDLGDFKLRFDPQEVRISIDGEIIDVGARREEPKFGGENIVKNITLDDGCVTREYSQKELQDLFYRLKDARELVKEIREDLRGWGGRN